MLKLEDAHMIRIQPKLGDIHIVVIPYLYSNLANFGCWYAALRKFPLDDPSPYLQA